MKIHPVNHAKGDKNRYCGPSAISIVTGMTTGEAARLIRTVNNLTSVKGTSTAEMSWALGHCGITMHRRILKPVKAMVGGKLETRPTLTQWYRDSKGYRTAGRVFLISAGHHWQIVSGRRFCCGRTGEIVSITAKGTNRRARVADVFELTAIRIVIPEIARKPKATIDPFRKRLNAVEKAHGFRGKVERFDSVISDYIVPPCAAFPRGFSTMHHGWDETLGRVEHCLDPETYESHADEDGHVSM